MFQTTNPTQRITIHFECFDSIPDDKYIAWLDGDEYRGITVSAPTIGECVKELGISLTALEIYRKNLKK